MITSRTILVILGAVHVSLVTCVARSAPFPAEQDCAAFEGGEDGESLAGSCPKKAIELSGPDWQVETSRIDSFADEFMNRINCTVMTVAISHRGKLLYAHGYGVQNRVSMTSARPDSIMRIASCSKPLTAAGIMLLVSMQKLSLDDHVFDVLPCRPVNAWGDARYQDITIEHLLTHRGGFDRVRDIDPMFETRLIAEQLGLRSNPNKCHIITYMLARPLQFRPGSQMVYSNFGYCLLGRVIAVVSGKSYIDFQKSELLQPLGIADIDLAYTEVSKRSSNEVDYPHERGRYDVEVMDSHGGLVASAPSLCRFLGAYRMNGVPRERDSETQATFFGSLPDTTTAMMCQRRDGIDVVVLCNARRNNHFRDDEVYLERRLNEVLNESINSLHVAED